MLSLPLRLISSIFCDITETLSASKFVQTTKGCIKKELQKVSSINSLSSLGFHGTKSSKSFTHRVAFFCFPSSPISSWFNCWSFFHTAEQTWRVWFLMCLERWRKYRFSLNLREEKCARIKSGRELEPKSHKMIFLLLSEVKYILMSLKGHQLQLIKHVSHSRLGIIHRHRHGSIWEESF